MTFKGLYINFTCLTWQTKAFFKSLVMRTAAKLKTVKTGIYESAALLGINIKQLYQSSPDKSHYYSIQANEHWLIVSLSNVFPYSGFKIHLPQWQPRRVMGLQCIAGELVSQHQSYSTWTTPFVIKIAKPGASGGLHVTNTSYLRSINYGNKDKSWYEGHESLF